MAFQGFFQVRTGGRGMTEITSRVVELVRQAGTVTGIAHVFVPAKWR